MDVHTALDVLRREAGLLAVSAGPALNRQVGRYPDWTVADLVVHTGRIHRWVTEIVRTAATAPPPRPDVAPDRTQAALTDWFMSGAADLALELESRDPAAKVWAFADDQSVGFWRTRMALETTIHRWDVQAATGTRARIAADVAAAGVTEALHVYLRRWLQGQPLGGAGERIVLRASDTGQEWSLTIHAEAIGLGDDEAATSPDATITGTADDLWRYLMGRSDEDALRTDGDVAAVRLCGAVIDLMPAAQR
jgi:uncharacterized protein (TIGR03083 family)